MIEKSYQYLCLKHCNKIRSWLFTNACNLLQDDSKIRVIDDSKIRVIDVNMSVDVVNMMSLKHLPTNDVVVYSTHMLSLNFTKDRYTQYRFVKDGEPIDISLENPDIVTLPFSLNSMFMDIQDFVKILKTVREKNAVCIGTMYDKEFIDTLSFESNVHLGKMFKIEKQSLEGPSDSVSVFNIMYTYNLYSGLCAQNVVQLYSKKTIEDIVKENGLEVTFTNFMDTGVVDETTLIPVKDSLRTRVCFIIKSQDAT